MLYQSLEQGLNGTPGDRKAFEARWTERALKELGNNPDWEMWEEIEELEEPVQEATRRVGSFRECDHLWNSNPEDFLGPRLYAP